MYKILLDRLSNKDNDKVELGCADIQCIRILYDEKYGKGKLDEHWHYDLITNTLERYLPF